MPDYTLTDRCQICHSPTKEVLSLGHLPLVDELPQSPSENVKTYPTPLLFCPTCQLVSLGCLVEPSVLFPAHYPYTSSTTRLLRENFADLALEAKSFLTLQPEDIVLDIGCNDGALLENFKTIAHPLGLTPENMAEQVRRRGIEVIQSYWTPQAALDIFKTHGQPKLITATNVLAHFKDVHEAVRSIKNLLDPQGLFISESGYLFSMLKDVQYDSIHHEHLRYYCLTSLKYLFDQHGLDILHVKMVPTHGGSIRVYTCHKGAYPINDSVPKLLQVEHMRNLNKPLLDEFRGRVEDNKIRLRKLLEERNAQGRTITALSAPGRATVLLNYTGIDAGLVTAIAEAPGSHKIGKYVPGAMIPIKSENEVLAMNSDDTLVLAWHMARELMPKYKAAGFSGDFIIPLPYPKIIKNQDV